MGKVLRYIAAIMQTKHFTWLEREFVEILAEGRAGVAPDLAVTELFEKFDTELKSFGLSLEDTARVRVWGRDKEARNLATAARSKILAGNRKAASSSFISQEWFDSDASAGLELLALRRQNSAAVRNPVDFVPARQYLCYLDYDSLLFFSGFTSEAPALEKQVTEVLATLEAALVRAGAEWGRVKKLSVLLQRGKEIAVVKQILAQAASRVVSDVEFSFVDGFAGEKYLLEIEATATAN